MSGGLRVLGMNVWLTRSIGMKVWWTRITRNESGELGV